MLILLPEAVSLNINRQVCQTQKLYCSLSNLISQYFPKRKFNSFLLMVVGLWCAVQCCLHSHLHFCKVQGWIIAERGDPFSSHPKQQHPKWQIFPDVWQGSATAPFFPLLHELSQVQEQAKYCQTIIVHSLMVFLVFSSQAAWPL